LLPASRRPSPPGRDTYGTSSLSSSSNSGSCKGSDSSPTPRLPALDPGVRGAKRRHLGRFLSIAGHQGRSRAARWPGCAEPVTAFLLLLCRKKGSEPPAALASRDLVFPRAAGPQGLSRAVPARRRPTPLSPGTSPCVSRRPGQLLSRGRLRPSPLRPAKYNLCSDNHGIKPPTPEQYLTPLQQKEVCIRHLKARLKDTQERLQDRDAEIEDLKTQLSRMQEDWIEEECHRVEAQLALKEARKEIKQLKQVIDTVKNNLMEKDKGLQKYFVDINIQNKKLETLLHSMEIAQNGAPKEEGAGESAGGSPARSLTRSSTYTKLSDQAAGDRNGGGGSQTISVDEGADSGFANADEPPSRTDWPEPPTRLPASSTYEKLLGPQPGVEAGVQASCMQERAIQTDFAHYQPDLDTILEKVMKSQACSLGSPTSAWVSEMEDLPPGAEQPNFSGAADLVAPDANASVAIACAAEEEEAAAAAEAEASRDAAPSKSYWSRHFIVDLLAVVVPAVPTVAWLCRSQRRQDQPIYNISSLLRGCCTVALHSIRKISCRSVGHPGAGGGSQL
uniref:Syntaphilin n=1 Tax=Apteryx owenii TaxID=8824 RepID=A0A8B9NXW5_APTOW